MNREIDERVFWCRMADGRIESYQLPPVGTGLPKGANELALIYSATHALHTQSMVELVRAICAIPSRREYIYVEKMVERIFGKAPEEFEKDFVQCLYETFKQYAKLNQFNYTQKAIAARELQMIIGFNNYNQKRVKAILKLLGE